MVALGQTRNGQTNNIEIIDLSSSESSCNNFPPYPYATERAKGQLSFHEIPLICGGYDPSRNECKIFEYGEWRSFGSMTVAKYDFAITKSSFGTGTQLFLSGGFTGSRTLSTLEVLTQYGIKEASLKLPNSVDVHTMVMLNNTHMILIGGRQEQNSIASGKTHILNMENFEWLNGPQLTFPRYLHSCCRIAKNNQGTENSIIVVGGWTDDEISSSVEILDERSSEWRKGPELPFPICCSAMVEHPDGGAVLIGGRRDSSTYLDTIFHLPHAGENARWKEFPQKLNVARGFHTAFLVPDTVADSC